MIEDCSSGCIPLKMFFRNFKYKTFLLNGCSSPKYQDFIDGNINIELLLTLYGKMTNFDDLK